MQHLIGPVAYATAGTCEYCAQFVFQTCLRTNNIIAITFVDIRRQLAVYKEKQAAWQISLADAVRRPYAVESAVERLVLAYPDTRATLQE